jgi:hypothetical protein
MTAGDRPDTLLEALAQLPAPAPDAARDARILAHCHQAMRRPRSRRARVLDAVLGTAVALYGATIVTEGLRVLLR